MLNEKLSLNENNPESEEEAVDISLLPDNEPCVPLDVLYARQEQLDDLYYMYGDDFDQICNLAGIINAREEDYC